MIVFGYFNYNENVYSMNIVCRKRLGVNICVGRWKRLGGKDEVGGEDEAVEEAEVDGEDENLVCG